MTYSRGLCRGASPSSLASVPREADATPSDCSDGSAFHGSKDRSSTDSPRTLRQASRAFRPIASRFSETATPTATPTTATPTMAAPLLPEGRVFDACSSTSFETGRARRTNWALASRSPPAPIVSFERSRPDVSTANKRRSSRFFGTGAAPIVGGDSSIDHRADNWVTERTLLDSCRTWHSAVQKVMRHCQDLVRSSPSNRAWATGRVLIPIPSRSDMTGRPEVTRVP